MSSKITSAGAAMSRLALTIRSDPEWLVTLAIQAHNWR
jgi:hypothetical protein